MGRGGGAEECEVGPSVCSQCTHVLPASIHPRQVRGEGVLTGLFKTPVASHWALQKGPMSQCRF